jgi:competence ComEA-like helix-hairpin-helix protein
MDAAICPAPAVPPALITSPSNSPQQKAGLLAAWPRSAQVTTAFLLGVAITALGMHVLGYLRWGARPTDLERGAVPMYRVDLNRADHAALLQLPGVGDNLATRIEERRSAQGPFRKVDDLRTVKGVGPATLERLRDWVEVEREDASADVGGVDKPAAKKAGSGRKSLPSSPVDLNRASTEELQKLPDIGPAYAKRIIEERQKRPFENVDDLRRVPGIKDKRLESLRPYVMVQRVNAAN